MLKLRCKLKTFAAWSCEVRRKRKTTRAVAQVFGVAEVFFFMRRRPLPSAAHRNGGLNLSKQINEVFNIGKACIRAAHKVIDPWHSVLLIVLVRQWHTAENSPSLHTLMQIFKPQPRRFRPSPNSKSNYLLIFICRLPSRAQDDSKEPLFSECSSKASWKPVV